MTSPRAVAALSLAALLAACGSSSSSERKLDLQGFVDGYADTMCSALVRCSCTDASALADCKTVYREYMTLSSAETFLTYPGARIDPGAARTCLSDLAAALRTCPSPTGGGSGVSSGSPLVVAPAAAPMSSGPVTFLDVPSCDSARLVVGVQAAGEHCSSGMECAAGLACDQLERRCVTAPVAEASCADTSGCADGLYCTGAGVCAPIPASGEPCDEDDQVCAEGTRCVLASGTYTCVAPHAAGESCADGAGCAAGLYCDSTCQALIADGEACDDGYPCAHDWCNAGVCDDPGFCAFVLQR